MGTAFAILIAWVGGVLIFTAIARLRNRSIGRFIHCQGVRLHYVERGRADAPALVLLHGNGAMIHDMEISGLLDLAAQKFRVVCFDRPGFGHSTRPRWKLWTPAAQARLLADALDQLDIKEPIVLGHSFGTLVALAFALETEKPIKALTLVSGYYFPTVRFDFWMLSGPAIPVLGDLMRYTIAPVIAWRILPALVRKLFSPCAVPERFEKRFPRALLLRPSQLRAAAEESALIVPSAAAFEMRYGSLRCPVAVIAGKGDEIVESGQAERLQRMLPRAIVHIIPDTGHMVHYAHPDRIVDALELVHHWPKEAVGESVSTT